MFVFEKVPNSLQKSLCTSYEKKYTKNTLQYSYMMKAKILDLV